METMTVWILFTIIGNMNYISISPPFSNVESCEKVKMTASEMLGGESKTKNLKCLSVQMPINKK